MAEVHRLTGGSDEFIRLIRQIEKRVGSLETRPTGSIYMNEQLITSDPATGVDTIFGALPDGTSGLQQWVNDVTPPDQPSTPTVKGGSTIFEITWNGLDVNGAPPPPDYDRTVVEMSTDPALGIWSEVNHLKAAGRVVVGEQPTKVLRYFRLVSIDANGNRSVPSSTVSDQLTPYIESPEMTDYINQTELDIQAAEKAGVDAASGKNTNYYGTVEPTPPANGFTVGDLWFDEGKNNEPKRWNGTAWATVRDKDIAVVDNRVDTVTTTVNGKNTNTTSTNAAPATYTGTTGDIWWQKDTAAPYAIIKQSTWDATAGTWTEQQVGSTVIANLDAGKISSGIIDAGRIGANSITAEKIVIGTTANLIPDPQFRFPAEWSGGYVDVQGTGMNGGGSFLIGDGTVQRGGYLGLTNGNFRMPVVPGLKYRVGAWVTTTLVAPIDSLAVYIRAYSSTDSTKTYTFTTPNRAHNTKDTVANTWTEISTIVTVPDGYDRLVMGLYVQSTYGGTARFSDPFVQQATSNVLIADGSVSAAKMIAGTITADSGIIGSLDAGKITVGEMNGQRVQAGSIQADRLVVGQGENFIVDANFPAPVAAPINLTQKRIDQAAAGASWVSPNRIGWNATVADTTTRFIRLGNQISDTNLATIPVIPGRNYVVSWQVYSDATSTTVGTRAAINWLKADGTSAYLAGTPSTFTPISAIGINAEITNEFTAPADAVMMRVDLQTNGHHGGGRLDFLKPVIRLMTDGTVITKDAVLTKHIMADQIEGGHIKADSVGSKLITAGTLQTSTAASTGVKINSNGIVSYGADGLPKVEINADGTASFTGKVTITSGSVPAGTVSGELATTNVPVLPTDKVNGLPDKITTYDSTTSTVGSWTMTGTTTIDGGKIATDTIKAAQIHAGEVGAELVTAGTLKSTVGANGEYTIMDSNGFRATNGTEQTVNLTGKDNLLVGELRTAPVDKPGIIMTNNSGMTIDGPGIWLSTDGTRSAYQPAIWVNMTSGDLHIRPRVKTDTQSAGSVKLEGRFVYTDRIGYSGTGTGAEMNADGVIASNLTTTNITNFTTGLVLASKAADTNLLLKATNDVAIEVGGTAKSVRFYSAGTSYYGATISDTANLHMNSSGYILKSTSSKRYKELIQDWIIDPNKVLSLQPRMWKDKQQGGRKEDASWYVGFIAEEVEELFPELVTYVTDNSTGQQIADGLRYDRFSAVLIQKIKEMDARIKLLEGAK